MSERLPAKVKRTGKRQLSAQLNDAEARKLEAYRRRLGLRSWGHAVRMLIYEHWAG